MQPDLTGLLDLELEQLAAGGDRAAFSELYERYAARVYDFLVRMIRDGEEAADIMQETFVRAMGALTPNRAGAAAFSTYLFTIARNLALNRIQRRKRTVRIDREDDDDSAACQLADPGQFANPQQAAETQELARLVWEAAKGLEPKQYSLLDLHVRQGLDSGEIAQVLGVSKGNAYTMLSRLRDTFESAVAGLVMFERGRRNCSALDGLLTAQGHKEMSPAVRKVVDRHTDVCPTCTDERRRLVSARALLPLLALLALPFALRRRVAEAAQEEWEQCLQNPPTGAPGGAGVTPPSPLTIVSRIAMSSWGGVGVAAAVVVLTVGGTCVIPRVGGYLDAGGEGGSAMTAERSRENAVAGIAVTPSRTRTGEASSATHVPTADASGGTSVATLTPGVDTDAASPTIVAVDEPTVAPTVMDDSTPTVTTAPLPTAVTTSCGVATILGASTIDASYAAALIDLTNQYRVSQGQPVLRTDAALNAAAAEYAEFVAETEWWLHHPDGMVLGGVYVPGIHIDTGCHDMYDRAVAAGYPPAPVGENVMWGTHDLPSENMFSIMLASDHEDPSRSLFVAMGIACFRRPDPAPAEIACVQVLGG